MTQQNNYTFAEEIAEKGLESISEFQISTVKDKKLKIEF